MEDVLTMMVPIIGVLVVGLIVLVPVAGLTVRFAVKPMIDAYLAFRREGSAGGEVQALERRIALLEEEQRAMQRALGVVMSAEPRGVIGEERPAARFPLPG